LIFFGLIYLLRKLAPWILKYVLNRLYNKVEQQAKQQQQQNNKSTKSNKTKTSSSKIGEYIDYEEIE
jgi:hypothetical protein